MSRAIDRAPRPEKVREVKLAVLSMSRSGTLGIYRALSILGYRPYHMMEVLQNQMPDSRYLREAIDAKYLGKGKRFTREEYDKWFANYDAIVELGGAWSGPDNFIEAYPDIKYILTERDPDAWVRSYRSTIVAFMEATHRFPLCVAKHFDAYVYDFCRALDDACGRWNGGLGFTDAGFAHARQYYVDYNARVRELVPADRLLCVRLEEGLDWEQICPFIGCEVPEAKWPMRHNADEFNRNMANTMGPSIQKAMVRMALTFTTTVLVPVVGTGVWYWMQRR